MRGVVGSLSPSVSNLVTIPQLHYHPKHYTRAAPVAPPAASAKKKDDDRCASVSVLRVTFGVYIPESRVCHSPGEVTLSSPHQCVVATLPL